jgi:hypothetical protein
MREIAEALLRCTTLAIPAQSRAGPGIQQGKERSLSFWFNMERNSIKSIVAAPPPCIARCAREALWLCVSFSTLARASTSDWGNKALRRSIWRFSRQARVEPLAL